MDKALFWNSIELVLGSTPINQLVFVKKRRKEWKEFQAHFCPVRANSRDVCDIYDVILDFLQHVILCDHQPAILEGEKSLMVVGVVKHIHLKGDKWKRLFFEKKKRNRI